MVFMSKDLPYRKNLRLKYFDYSSENAYFVTVCTYGCECLFGKIVGARHAVPGFQKLTPDIQQNTPNGQPVDIKLSPMGKISYDFWSEIPKHFPNVELGPVVFMPNHMHGIIVIKEQKRGVGAENTKNAGTACRAPTKSEFGKPIPGSLSTIIGSYKSAVTKRIRKLVNDPRFLVWQRNYYEHIIRNEKDYERIYEYIILNPERWEEDCENPEKFN